jgi:hypothetical protein
MCIWDSFWIHNVTNIRKKTILFSRKNPHFYKDLYGFLENAKRIIFLNHQVLPVHDFLLFPYQIQAHS